MYWNVQKRENDDVNTCWHSYKKGTFRESKGVCTLIHIAKLPGRGYGNHN
jgi:hypothetical protein